MCDKIENSMKCEVRSVIWFFNTKKVRLTEIYRQIQNIYGETVMNEALVRKWCITFNDGQTNVHNDERLVGHL